MRTTFAASGVRGSSRSGEIGGDARIALFLDVDGTLLDLAERPDEVIVPPGLVTSLAAAQAKTDGALALISGRVIADLDRLFQPLKLAASGTKVGNISALGCQKPLGGVSGIGVIVFVGASLNVSSDRNGHLSSCSI